MRIAVDKNVIIDALKPNPQFEADIQQILCLTSMKERLLKDKTMPVQECEGVKW